MPYEPTALERHAADETRLALAMIDHAKEHLRQAEADLLAEERQHAPHVGIANQHKMLAYSDAMRGLAATRKKIVQHISGEPNVGTAA